LRQEQTGLFILKKIAQTQKLFFAPSRLHGKFYLQKFLKSRFICIAFLLMFALFFTDCKSETNQLQRNVPTREVFDDLGHSVKIPATVERAVSLAPNLTEIVFAVGAGDRLVGVTTYCNYPAQAQEIRKIGDTINPNIETIIALKPQIVLVSTASQIETFTRQLEQQNIAVFVTNPNGLDDIYKSVEKIGELFGRQENACQVVGNMQKRVADIQAKTNTVNRVTVFLQISKEPLVTVGKATFFTDLIERAGGISLTKDVATAYPRLSKETALALNPEAIILSDSEDNREPNDVFKNSPAVKNGKVFRVDADILSRPAPRIVDALELIARDLHPESFR
jgi:iron complex transport system substrate-binding protein